MKKIVKMWTSAATAEDVQLIVKLANSKIGISNAIQRSNHGECVSFGDNGFAIIGTDVTEKAIEKVFDDIKVAKAKADKK